MPIKRPPLITGEIYHIVLRGVEQRDIFLDESDYYRGIFSIYEFNNSIPVEIRKRREARRQEKKRGEQFSADKRELFVEILDFCFMPNHIHLLLRQTRERGISNFMRKVGAGYGSYFNKKYKRVGHLFQGRFRAVAVEDDDQLKNVFVYIHTNPIALVEPGWKEEGIKRPREAIKFVENYKWSSYQDYIGKKNFPSVTERKFLSEVMDGAEGGKSFVDDWVKYKGEIATLGDIVLE